jgi:hypothetical protein
MAKLPIVFILLLLPRAHSEVVSCTLTLSSSTTRLVQEPLKSQKKVQLKLRDGLCSERHRFDLTGTELECEVSFCGRDVGTLINCWNSDFSMGIQSDRSTVKAKGESSRPNRLSVSSSKGQSSIEFWCP